MGKFNVADKVCLVTGSGRGLGKEFAVRLLTQKAKVCLSDVNEDLGQQAAAELAQKFGEDRVSFCKLDVTQTAEWEEAFNHCQTVFKCSVEVLVNNAGIGPNTNHQLVLRINIEGVMNGSQAFLDRFGKTKGGSGGRIIQIASMAGLFNGPPMNKSAYYAAKSAVVSYNRQFAHTNKKGTRGAWLEEGVKSYALCPWYVDTEMVRKSPDFTSVDELKKRSGMGLLSVAVVGDVFEQALEQDDNGSVYAIMPGLPPLKMPNWNPILIAPTAIMAKLLGSNKPFDAKNALMGGILIMMILSFFAGFVMSYIFF